MKTSRGVVQAHVIGGNRALQARLDLWKARTPQTIQRQSKPGVEAFRVPLRPKAGGLPLPSDVRTKMETAFGSDFSDIRVHIGHEASALGAIAYTWGTNIHFAPGQYNPHTLEGQKLLGHELWHVVQQRSGRVTNPFGGGVAAGPGPRVGSGGRSHGRQGCNDSNAQEQEQRVVILCESMP